MSYDNYSIQDVTPATLRLSESLLKRYFNNMYSGVIPYSKIEVACNADDVLGFIAYDILYIDSYNPLHGKGTEFIQGKISVLLVDSLFRFRGIGSRLLGAACVNLIKSKCNIIVFPIRKYCRSDYIVELLNKFGFYAEDEIKEYWKYESLCKKYKCKVCGAPPCKCTAIMFIKKI
jgi:ribosomal protein S18 acetylase RimI-like enzyme